MPLMQAVAQSQNRRYNGGMIPEVTMMIALRARIEAGVPHPAEHEALQWVDAAQLRAMLDAGRLVPADTVWVPELLADLGP